MGGDPTYFLPKVEPGRLMGILLRRGWIVILASLIGGGALYYVASKMPKIYQAFGSVLVNSQAPLVMDIITLNAGEGGAMNSQLLEAWRMFSRIANRRSAV